MFEIRPDELSGKSIYFVGIKGTGMSALAELWTLDGAKISGSDVPDHFFTELSLINRKIPFINGFREQNVPPNADLIVYSAAYSPETHPELVHAKELKVPMINYTQALGEYSRHFTSVGVAGVHGKTTTTALLGIMLKELNIPFRLLTGSIVPDFGNSAIFNNGGKFFVAETCEYRRHFLNFHPTKILLTSIEPDHQDYYPNLSSIMSAFQEYVNSLPLGGTLVYCCDDGNVLELVESIRGQRPDISFIPYGLSSKANQFQIVEIQETRGLIEFRLAGYPTVFQLTIPGRHNVVNSCGAFAMMMDLFHESFQRQPEKHEIEQVAHGLKNFRSTHRRSQLLGRKNGVIIMDDYAHHPTAIQKTLQGIRAFYQPKRLIVSFMSHTYSRTQALLEDFAKSFNAADVVLLHKIYASAREKNQTGISAEILFEETKKFHPEVYFFEEPENALSFLSSFLKEGDLFLTMGAGDNWKLGNLLLEATL